MKTNLVVSLLFLAATMLYTSCDEVNEDLLKDLAEGKMIVVINNGESEILQQCTWFNYGDNLAGEVFINGVKDLTTTTPNLNIMYGSWSNAVQLAVKTYNTGVEADKMHVNSSYGFSDTDAPVVVEITEITATAIKGKFSGKLKLEAGGTVDIKGAFYAKKGEQPM
jgi:hypothetical protein